MHSLGGIVDIFGTSFSGNTAASNNGKDIYRYGGTITIHDTCDFIGLDPTSPTSGITLDTYGTIGGTAKSFSSCNSCVDGKYKSLSDSSACLSCPVGKVYGDSGIPSYGLG